MLRSQGMKLRASALALPKAGEGGGDLCTGCCVAAQPLGKGEMVPVSAGRVSPSLSASKQ